MCIFAAEIENLTVAERVGGCARCNTELTVDGSWGGASAIQL
jgi:hypothetical protein